MEGTGTNDTQNGQLSIQPNSMNPFGSGAQAHLYQDKLTQIAALSNEAVMLKKMVEDLRIEKQQLRDDQREMKFEYELKIRGLEQDIKDRDRELTEANNSGALGGLIPKETITPEVLEKGMALIPELINSIKGNPAQSSQQLEGPQMSEDAKALVGWYDKLTPEYKKPFDLLIVHIIKSGISGIEFMNKIINENGIINTTQQGQSAHQG